jgi:hypothetical protein
MVQYGMWLTRPRSVREFRGHTESVEYAGPYFQPILDAVDRVYTNPMLQKFWRKGTLVVNPRGKHPYQSAIPPEYQKAPRWFLLHTNLTPKELAPTEFDNAKPPSRQVEIPVFALALVLGAAPQREWLVYAHSPRHARLGVTITVPDLGPITVDVPQSGSFFHVKENGKQVEPVIKGGPASLRLEAPRFVDVGAPAAFAVTDKYTPVDPIDAVAWDFGDAGKATGDKATHRFARPGQYLVAVTGSRAGQAEVTEQVPVFVGFKPEDGLVCRLLMKGALRDGMKSWIWHSGWDKVDYHFIPDASGAGNFGFLAGGAWVNDEQRGTVLELNGKRDRVEINNTVDINTGSAVRQRSIAFWFRAHTRSDKEKEPRQVLYEEGGPGSGLNVYLDGPVLHAGAWNQDKAGWLQTKALEHSAWHHVALILRGTDARDPQIPMELYLNGEKVAEGKAPVIGSHPGDINIGRCGNTLFHDGKKGDNPGYYFAGRIDEFRILNRAMEPDALRDLVRRR